MINRSIIKVTYPAPPVTMLKTNSIRDLHVSKLISVQHSPERPSLSCFHLRQAWLVLFLLAGFGSLGQVVKNKVVRCEVHFQTGKWQISDADTAALTFICNEVRNRENYRIEVVGHTDSVGNHHYNLDLSRKRAETVKRYLLDHYASPDKVQVKASSFSAPAASNTTEEGKRKNRRTVVAVTLIYFAVSALEPVEGLRPGATFDLRVLFEFNTAEFKKGSTANLDVLLDLLARYPDLQFEILGWTAVAQSASSDLSGLRAKAVYEHLLEHGVDAARMTHKGMGGAGCTGEKMLEKCRRVEIAITRNPYWKEAKP